MRTLQTAGSEVLTEQGYGEKTTGRIGQDKAQAGLFYPTTQAFLQYKRKALQAPGRRRSSPRHLADTPVRQSVIQKNLAHIHTNNQNSSLYVNRFSQRAHRRTAGKQTLFFLSSSSSQKLFVPTHSSLPVISGKSAAPVRERSGICKQISAHESHRSENN